MSKLHLHTCHQCERLMTCCCDDPKNEALMCLYCQAAPIIAQCLTQDEVDRAVREWEEGRRP